MEKNKVSKDSLISKIIKDYPETTNILTKYSLHCANCFLSEYETIEIGGKIHGLSNKEIEKLVNEMNILIKKSDKRNIF